MKNKFKENNYMKWGLTIFVSISACILLFFICLRLDTILFYIYSFFKTLLPIFLGLLLAYLLNPFVKYLEKKISKLIKRSKYKIKNITKFSRMISITCTYLIVSFIVFLFIKFVMPSLFDSIELMITNIPIYINNVYDYFKNILMDNPDLAKLLESVNTTVTDLLGQISFPSIDTIMVNITQGISSAVQILVTFIIAIIVSIYLLYDKEMFINNTKRAMEALLPENIYNSVMTTLKYTDAVFGGFMIAKVIDSLIIGVITFIICAILQIPYSLIISIIVAITNIVPYFGPIIGALICGLFLLIVSPAKCITFVIIIFLVQQFDSNILGPKLIGNKTGIKSFWILFSIVLFGGLFGVVGMIFGVPIFAIIYSLVATYINKKLNKKRKD